MVIFAMSGAVVLAVVCWAMLRESPPVPEHRGDIDAGARIVADVESDRGARGVAHAGGDTYLGAVAQGEDEAAARVADPDEGPGADHRQWPAADRQQGPAVDGREPRAVLDEATPRE